MDGKQIAAVFWAVAVERKTNGQSKRFSWQCLSCWTPEMSHKWLQTSQPSFCVRQRLCCILYTAHLPAVA